MNAHFATVQGLFNALANNEVGRDDICYCDENGGIYTHDKWYGLPEAQSGETGGAVAARKNYCSVIGDSNSVSFTPSYLGITEDGWYEFDVVLDGIDYVVKYSALADVAKNRFTKGTVIHPSGVIGNKKIKYNVHCSAYNIVIESTTSELTPTN